MAHRWVGPIRTPAVALSPMLNNSPFPWDAMSTSQSVDCRSANLFKANLFKVGTVVGVVLLAAMAVGCSDDMQQVREIQAQRQQQMQAQSQQDHIGEAFNLLSHLVELNDAQARRQITYHLNRWAEPKQLEQLPPTDMLRAGTVLLHA